MRFNMRIAISVLAGTVLLALLGMGIWRMVEADERGERRGARYETIGPNDKAAITADQAIAAALAAHPDAAAVRTALEKERGTLLYSVKLNTGQEVQVDANTGQVLATVREGDDDDDD
jgi:uncharacterized membrane protein YkoI